jgi:predicted nucleic acid-binding protein
VIAYFDSSALLKLLLPESGSAEAKRVWTSGIRRSTSRIAHAELACALGAAVRQGRLTHADAGVVDGTFLRGNADLIEADDSIVSGAAVLGVRHGLKGLDAIHVSSALSLREFDPLVVSWDVRQRAAARAEGLPIYPEETTTAALR